MLLSSNFHSLILSQAEMILKLKVLTLRDLSFVYSIPERKSIHRVKTKQDLFCLGIACGISRACEERGNQHKALRRA